MLSHNRSNAAASHCMIVAPAVAFILSPPAASQQPSVCSTAMHPRTHLTQVCPACSKSLRALDLCTSVLQLPLDGSDKTIEELGFADGDMVTVRTRDGGAAPSMAQRGRSISATRSLSRNSMRSSKSFSKNLSPSMQSLVRFFLAVHSLMGIVIFSKIRWASTCAHEYLPCQHAHR